MRRLHSLSLGYSRQSIDLRSDMTHLNLISKLKTQNSKLKTQNSKLRTQNSEHGTRNTEHGVHRDPLLAANSLVLEIWSVMVLSSSDPGGRSFSSFCHCSMAL